MTIYYIKRYNNIKYNTDCDLFPSKKYRMVAMKFRKEIVRFCYTSTYIGRLCLIMTHEMVTAYKNIGYYIIEKINAH